MMDKSGINWRYKFWSGAACDEEKKKSAEKSAESAEKSENSKNIQRFGLFIRKKSADPVNHTNAFML